MTLSITLIAQPYDSSNLLGFFFFKQLIRYYLSTIFNYAGIQSLFCFVRCFFSRLILLGIIQTSGLFPQLLN